MGSRLSFRQRAAPFPLLLGALLVCVTAFGANPPRASAAPSCNNLTIYMILYVTTTQPLSNYGPDGCYASHRLIQDKDSSDITSINPQGHVYMICGFSGIKENAGAPLRVYDDTNYNHSYSDQQQALNTCVDQHPTTSTINVEFMAAANPCSPSECWDYVVGNETVNRFYPELYFGQTYVENLLSAWENGTYDANPSTTAGTMNSSPFDYNQQPSFYGVWSSLQTDVYDLCHNTADNYMGIYVGSPISNQPSGYFNAGHGYDAAEDVWVQALNSCV